MSLTLPSASTSVSVDAILPLILAWLEGDLSSAYSHINIVVFVVLQVLLLVLLRSLLQLVLTAPLAATAALAAAPVPVTLPSASSKRRDVGLVQLHGGLQ